MADTKISALTAATPIATDETVIVDDPGGTPLSKRVTVGQMLDIISGDINVSNTGASTYNALSIVNADISATALIAISKLAAGTDGELITWDSSGVIDTVSTGTSGQRLESNGAGAAPSFKTRVTPKCVAGYNINNYGLFANNFSGFFGNFVSVVTTTESTISVVWDFAWECNQFRFVAGTNTLNANTVVSVRAGAADITGTALTIIASTAGKSDSGALTTAVADNSLIATRVDSNLSASGAMTLVVAVMVYNVTA